MSTLLAKQVTVVLGDRTIIRDCNLAAKKGEFIGIIGPNGSGKTTFLKALRGIFPVVEGEIILNDKKIAAMKDKDIAREVAYMQQSINLGFGYTASEIVMTARYPYLKWWENEGPEDEKIVERAMRFAGVWHLRNHAVNAVSGGEKQRIFLAKALAQQTDILLLDEPTAALDMVYADEIFRYCRKLCEEGKTIILVVHDLEIAAKFCTRLIMFSEGKIVADGKPEEVLTAINMKNAFHLSSCVYPDPLFNQLRIYVYPSGEKNPEAHRRDVSIPLPESATLEIGDGLWRGGREEAGSCYTGDGHE